MTFKLIHNDPADRLKSREDAVSYINGALESGDPEKIAFSIGTAARALGIEEVSRLTGFTERQIYRSFCTTDGRPTIKSAVVLLNALGLRLRVE